MTVIRIRLSAISLNLGGAALLFLSPTRAAALTIPRVSAVLDRDRVAVGENAVLTVSAAWIGAPSEFTFSTPDPPECRELTVAGSAQRSMVYRTDGEQHQVREFLFTLKGSLEGPGRVGAVRFLYRRRGEEQDHPLVTAPLDIPVVSGGPELLSPATLLLIPGGLAAVLLIMVYVRWTIRRYKKQSNAVIADYVKNREAESLRKLDGVRKLKAEGDIDGYLERIWEVLADYLEKKYAVTLSPDARDAVPGGPGAPGLSGEAGAELARILKLLEESRFGSARAENRELDGILKRVYGFIESQKDHSPNTNT
ncbi:MAG: hypothetical protein V1789_11345 [PVC group bacterium]